MKPRNYYPLLSISVLAISMVSFGWQYIESTQATQQTGSSQVGTITKVSDGDTLTIESDGKQEEIRLCGVNTPEHNQLLGKEAKQALERIAQGKQVVFTTVDYDRDGRTVAEVFVVGKSEHFINGDLVEAGLAHHHEQHSDKCPNKAAIVLAETIAKSKRVGVWAIP